MPQTPPPTGPSGPAAGLTTPSPDPRRPRTARLAGVDAARGVALLGLAAVHVMPPLTGHGAPGPLHLVFAGGAAALFVVLAGVGLSLASGGVRPVGRARAALLRRRTARRATLLFGLGLVCGWAGAPVAVILCHYALMFVLVLPLLRARLRTLAAVGAAWVTAGPLLVFAAATAGQRLLGREEFLTGGRLWVSPSPEHLADLPLLLLDLTVTGYYPVLSWTGFMVLGMALGRLQLRSPRTAGCLLTAGAAASGGMWVLGTAVRAAPGVMARVAAATHAPVAELSATVLVGEHRLAWLVPDPLWLTMVTPHSGSPLEAVRAAGWAAAVLGLCLLAGTGVLAGTGRLSLSLYVGHLVLLGVAAAAGAPLQGPAAVVLLWALFLGAGLVAHRTGRRGPLEALTAALSRAGEQPGQRVR
ncbi:heparan-alpha-glucosaminide N-acetyltransferase domain-containing protein [Micrococcus sp.]|uniref:heparan-alpha-glucosaminide N-acetyltransferase domain-containing protein n=1 Tax=Micrococcus sp. TaxID=1271 RepID=UPI002A918A3F|nr:heparan-alpha-glucosaminide N-acetyltransferase domain-containing protein [Micrococcus sp.]MDY6055123.1 heparan-alpha-glucosaminide N-acetyltransferase domain-containing protein [Micrococcus sp.]